MGHIGHGARELLHPVTMILIPVVLAQDERERALGVCSATVMGDWQWESSPPVSSRSGVQSCYQEKQDWESPKSN